MTESASAGGRASAHAADRLVLGLVTLLACLPFSQVMVLRLGGITLFAFDLIYLALAATLVVRLATHRCFHVAPLFLFIGAVAVSTAHALSSADSPSLHLMLYQGRYFLPFVVAALIVATGTTIRLKSLLVALCAGALISASAALAVNYLFPGFLVRQFSFADEISELAMVQGRLHWTNDSLAFMPFLAAALLPALKSRALQALLIVSGVVAAAVSFSRLNRTILAGLAAFVVILLAVSIVRARSSRTAPRVAARVGLVVLILAGMVYVLVSSNPQLAKTASARFPTDAEKLRTFLEGDLAGERGPIWRHYLEFAPADYALGQGLGRPLLFSDRVVYTSDVSYVAFLLVLGVLGLAALAALLYVLFGRLHTPGLPRPPNAWALTSLLVIVMVISLNVDWLSRDTMVIYLSLLVMSATQPAAGARLAHQPSSREIRHA